MKKEDILNIMFQNGQITMSQYLNLLNNMTNGKQIRNTH